MQNIEEVLKYYRGSLEIFARGGWILNKYGVIFEERNFYINIRRKKMHGKKYII